jgi:hypothetical protein
LLPLPQADVLRIAVIFRVVQEESLISVCVEPVPIAFFARRAVWVINVFFLQTSSLEVAGSAENDKPVVVFGIFPGDPVEQALIFV